MEQASTDTFTPSVLLAALRPVEFPSPRVVEVIDERIGIANDVPGTAGRPVALGGGGIGRGPPAPVPSLEATCLGAVDERRLIDNLEMHPHPDPRQIAPCNACLGQQFGQHRHQAFGLAFFHWLVPLGYKLIAG